MSDTDYIAKIIKDRQERDNRVKTNPRNWLALAGLFCLNPGDNTFGTDPGGQIVLPQFSQNNCGVFRLEGNDITMTPAWGIDYHLNDKDPENRPLHCDRDDEPDLIEMGSLIMMIIKRGESFYLRVWDKESEAVRNFTGYKYYPVRPEYRIKAEFMRFNEPKILRTKDAIGLEHETCYLGEARFTVNFVGCSLLAEDAEDELLFNLTDETRKDTTYPGGRHLDTPKTKGKYITLDFNEAVNWPCAYTPFATCPLPPLENRLLLRIEAGEMRYHE